MISLDGRGLNGELAQIVNLVLVELKCLLFHLTTGDQGHSLAAFGIDFQLLLEITLSSCYNRTKKFSY